MKPMSRKFEVSDPRGVKVWCDDQTWEDHILRDSQHIEMRDNLNAVLETIQSPDVIYESHDSNPPRDYREVYVKETPIATYYNSDPYTKIITGNAGGSAEVITAYSARSITGGTIGDPIYRGEKHETEL
jgi:hypothetical protein